MNQRRSAGSDLYLLIALLLIFIIAARTPIDSDLWWHLRAGESTVHTMQPVTIDQYSFTRTSESWTNHSWLSQAILFICLQAGKYLLLSLFVAFLAAGSMYLVQLQMESAAISRTFLLTAGGIVASVVWVPRPQMFSFFFLALLSLLHRKFTHSQRKLFFFLVPMFILWSNLHGGYILGIIYLSCYLLSKVIKKTFMSKVNSESWRSIGMFAFVILGSYLVTAINPNGISMWFIPFNTVGVAGLQKLISEWASPDFHQPVQQLFLFYFFVSVFLLIFSKKQKKIDEIILFCCFGIMAFIARRNFGPFIIISLPILASHFDDVFLYFVKGNSFLNGLVEKTKAQQGHNGKSRTNRYFNGAILFILGFLGVMKLILVTQSDLVEQITSELYPKEAAEWINTNQPYGNMMNEYDWGGYLIWELRDYPVFIDGRTDLFGDEVLNDWLAVVQCGDGWEELLDDWSIGYMLVKPDRPIVRCVLYEGWEKVYSDEISVILLRPD